MISPSYNIFEFIDEIKDKDYIEIMDLATNEATIAEKRSYGVKGAVQARKEGSEYYVRQLKGLLFFLGNGMKPMGIYNEEFQLFRPICENLVEKKQLKQTVMNFFD